MTQRELTLASQLGTHRGTLRTVEDLLDDHELRQLGPHVIDCREHFSDVIITPHLWLALSNRVEVKGRGPGSLEPEDRAGLDYNVVPRSTIAREIPDLLLAYESFAPTISAVLGREVACSHDEGAIAINMVRPGGRYELHVDSQPWTLVLFVTEHRSGGELVAQHPLTGRQAYAPVIGQGVLMDGSRVPHGVLPVRGDDQLRITIPMVYIDPTVGDVRPEGTDDYIYGGKVTDNHSEE
jgi:hypothetical protein